MATATALLDREPACPMPITVTAELAGSMLDYAHVEGADLLARTAPFYAWQERRRQAGCWPYSSTIHERPMPSLEVSSESGVRARGLNFASQDYLGLSSHPAVLQSAREVLDRYGPHSAGSPVLQGNTTLSRQLEAQLAEALRMHHVVLFPTGWAAGFGAVKALVRPDDHVIFDRLTHNCLSVGAHAATTNLHRVRHLDVDAARRKLQRVRERDTHNGILMITEGVFSMDADSPNIAALQEVCHEYQATLLVDVAHDFGSMGPGGTGAIGEQGMLGGVDLVMGSFSKTFASNGGFLATNSPAVRQYVKFYGPSHTFSNALSPVQAAVVLEALRITRSDEGAELRRRMLSASLELRQSLRAKQLRCLGRPSPIVPVPLGSEATARRTSRAVGQRGLFANLVEYPAVAKGQARFRMQVMATHTTADARRAAGIIAESHRIAGAE